MDELEAIALAAAAKRKKQGQQYDEMGFPVQPDGGSSVDPQAVDEMQSKGRALATGIANGASYGFGDNIAGVIEGTKELAQGRSFGRGYDYGVEMARQGTALDQAANPGAMMTGNLIGAGAQGLATAPLAGGASLLGTMGRGGVIGGIEGGLQGAGNADGQDVLGETIRGTLIGGTAGIAAPAVVSGAAAIKNAAFDPITGLWDAMLSRASAGKANRAVGQAVRSSGMTKQEIIDAVTRAAREGQPEYRLMDALGIAGQRQASGMARAGGDAGTEIQNFLTQRQIDQGDRVGGFVEDAFGVGGTTAAQTRDALNTARKATNTANYTAARQNAGPVNLTDAIETIDKLTGRNPLIGDSSLVSSEIGKRLAGLRAQLGDSNSQLIDFDQVLNVKEDLGKVIGRIKKSGDEVPFELAQVYGALDKALEKASDGYRAANTAALEGRKVVNAVDAGAGMAARGRAADNVPAFNAMTAAEQDAARVGYGDLLLNRLEAVTSPTSNRAKPLLSTKRTTEADAMALGPTIYRDRLNRENQMWETQNRALGGSRTADNLQDIEAMDGLAGGVLDVARSAGNLQFGDTVAKIAGMLGPIAKGQTDETRQLIVKILMSDDPAKALAPVLRQQMLSDAKRRTVEALLRQPMREAGLALGQ